MSLLAPPRTSAVRRLAKAPHHQHRHSSNIFNHFISQDTAAPTLPTPTPFRLAVKDNIATADPLPTTCASAILATHRSPFEATVVRQLRARGARVVGKTNMDEFGMGAHSTHSPHGAVRNPLRQPPASAGGSSGGSAVAVCAGDADVALGTDTGGSVRVPAAHTGVVGYKPSYGLVSRHGVVPYANSLDTVGFLARDVAGIRRLVVGPLGLQAEHDPCDPTSLAPGSRRRCTAAMAGVSGEERRLAELRGGAITVGIPLEYNIEELEPEVRQAWAEAAEQLRACGVKVVPVSLPSTKQALSAYYVIAPAEAASNLSKYDGVRYGAKGLGQTSASLEAEGEEEVLYSGVRGAGFGAEVQRRILLGTYSLSSEAMDNYFVQAQRVRRLVQRDFDRVFARPNPLRIDGSADEDGEQQHFDLSDMDEALVGLEDKLGPPQVDFLLSPTVPGFAPTLDALAQQTPVDAYMGDVFTVPASLAGLPAISVPGKAGTGGAVGLQLIGQFWDDARLLDFAHRLHSEILRK